MEIFREYARAAASYPWRSTIALISSTSNVLLNAFIGPYIIALMLDTIQTGNVHSDYMWQLIIIFAISQVAGEIIGWRVTTYALWTMEVAVMRKLAMNIFAKLSSHSLQFHNNRFGGSIVSQANKYIHGFERFFDTLVFQVVPIITSVVAAVIILSFVFWQYALMLFVISVVFAIAVIFISKYLRQLHVLEAQAQTRSTGRLADMIANISAVKAFGREKEEYKTFNTYTGDIQKRGIAAMRGFLTTSMISSSLITIMKIAAVVAAIVAVQQEQIAIGVVYLCVTYTFTVTRQLWEINSVMRNTYRILGDAHDMSEILKMPIDIKEPQKAESIRIKRGEIKYEKMNFQHADNDNNESLFANFSLTIPAGQRVGLVGHSGSGKTTLTRLLLRFADIDSGSISIDGQSISAISQADLRRSIAFVPQEPLLFHRSLTENIAYGKPDATDEEIREAAKKAHALEFIDKLPQGFDTLVGERGVKLSGGQRQRIAIARAILKDAPILVLDEATSALDSESEKLIQASLKDLMKNRTAIVIAHRLSTIQKMDRIVVLENGTIIEDGTHNELLARKGTYASLWNHQSGGFLEE